MANQFNTEEFTKAFQSMFQNIPGMDLEALNAPAKDIAEFNTKLNAIALETAKKNVELSTKWTQDVLADITGLNKPQETPADYASAASEVSAAQLKGAPERISQFAEVAKKAQVDAVELVMNTTKAMQAKATEAAKA